MPLDTTGQRVTVAAGIVLVSTYMVALAWAFDTQSFNVWGSMLMAPVLWAVNSVLIWQVGKREDDRWIVRLMGLGFALKMLGSFARYAMVFVLYSGGGDSARYNNYAAAYYQLWRQGMFVWQPGDKAGTQNLEIITTAVYTFIGPAPLTGFLVFACFAFWGCYLLYRAFRIGLPGGNHRLYAGLVFLLPSLLFWPSSIGKEAWLMLWLGVLALGVAKFFARQRWAWTLMTLGVLGTALIRPHITVLLVASLLVAQLFRPASERAIGVLSKALALGVLAVAAFILTTQSAEFLGIDDISVDTVIDRIDEASFQTEQGGSAFTPVPLNQPLGVPAAIVTLLFRPFLWEAETIPLFLQGLEGVLLMAILVRNRARIARLPHEMRANPYVTFAVVYSLTFILAFSGFANFGILARQRTLMLPLVLVICALPLGRKAQLDIDQRRLMHAAKRN